MSIVKLNGLVLPEDGAWKRDYLVSEEELTQDYVEKYDAHTLVYDAFWVPKKKKICLICPRLYNLEPLIKKGVFSSDKGTHSITSWYRLGRYEEIWLKCKEMPSYLRFEVDGLRIETPIERQDLETFANLNCAVIKSKDNDLTWIREWADYNVRMHGLEAVVFFDNDSEKYTIEDVEKTLLSVDGLKKVVVIPAPYLFGPRGYGKTLHSAKFLQVGLLNIARVRFLQKAGAVLLTDIDELIEPISESSIFEVTKKSLLGYSLFMGQWIYAKANGSFLRHKDHKFVKSDNHIKLTKYCVDMGGLLSFSHWEVHGSVRGFLKKKLINPDVHYWHCRQISTNWKTDRSGLLEEDLIFDQELEDFFEETFE